MKKALVISILAFYGMVNIPINAQSSTPFESTHFYVGLGVSAPQGGVVAMTLILPNGWGTSATYNLLTPVAQNLPSDYKGGSGIFNFFGSGNNDKVYDEITAISFRALKEFPTKSKYVRVGLEAGPSLVRTEIADNFVFRPVSGGDIFGYPSNYDYEVITSNTIGLSLKGKLELAFTRPFGFEIGITSNINSKRSYYGADFLITLGHVRDKIVK